MRTIDLSIPHFLL